MCADFRDYKSFLKGFSINFCGYLFLFLFFFPFFFFITAWSLDYLSVHPPMKAVNRENKKSQISVQFSAANVTSAVLEPDSKALFKVRKGGGVLARTTVLSLSS